MSKLNEKGYAEDWLVVIGSTLFIAFIPMLIVFLLFTRWEWSEANVSGVVYNTSNNGPIAGNTTFAVRASVDTYIDENHNASEFCLPQNSPHKELVNKAAADKDIKVVVTTQKGFWLKMPWTCIDNVTVVEAEQ